MCGGGAVNRFPQLWGRLVPPRSTQRDRDPTPPHPQKPLSSLSLASVATVLNSSAAPLSGKPSSKTYISTDTFPLVSRGSHTHPALALLSR
jgi:hypothetical protein